MKLLMWADIVFVMEKRHKQRLNENFRDIIAEKELVVLDIPDEYQFMDEELIDLIKISVSPYLK